MTTTASTEHQAVVTDGHGGIRLETVSLRRPGPGEVQLELVASGVCHTDLDSLGWGRELVVGHEGAGIVRHVGEGVDLDVGTRAVLNWAMPCGQCFQCSEGRQSICEKRDHGDHLSTTTRLGDRYVPRSFSLGTMSTGTVVPASAVVLIDVEIPFTSACIVGCGVMTGYGSVVNAARVKPGSSVVVLGCGGVGLNVVQAAVLAGASSVIAVDRSLSRLRMAATFGATTCIHVADGTIDDAVVQVRALCGGRGADYAFECTGVPQLAMAPLAFVRDAGTAVQVSGNETTAMVDLRLFEWDKTYINPLYGQCRPSIDIPRILHLYAAGRLRLDELAVERFPLRDAAVAIAAVRAGEVTKAVLEL